MPEVVSRKEDFLKGAFQPLLVDHVVNADRVLVCAGKVYWDLLKEAHEKKVQDRVAIIRVEQLYPLDKPG
jgi:2-oxoglutarate dehydrogenase E1 component